MSKRVIENGKIHFYQVSTEEIIDLGDVLSLEEIGYYLIIKNLYIKYCGVLSIENLPRYAKIFHPQEQKKLKNFAKRQFQTQDFIKNDEWDLIISSIQEKSEKATKSVVHRWKNDTFVDTFVDTNANTNDDTNVNVNVNVKDNVNVNVINKGKNYFFTGDVIKLSEKDYTQWKETFRFIDLDYWLKIFDVEFRNEKPKNWFVALSSKLAYQNGKAEKDAPEWKRKGYSNPSDDPNWGLI